MQKIWAHNIQKLPSVVYDSAVEKERFHEAFEQELANAGDTLVLSDETALEFGVPKPADFGVVLQRYQALFDGYELNAILVLRNQIDMLHSLAVYDRRKVQKFQPLDVWLEKIRAEQELGWLGRLDYAKYVHYLQSILGSEHVKLCLFETLKVDPNGFYRQVADFIGGHFEPNQTASDIPAEQPHENKRRSKVFMKYIEFGGFDKLIRLSKYIVPDFIRKALRKPVLAFKAKLESVLRNTGKECHVTIPDDFVSEFSRYFGKGNRELSSVDDAFQHYNYPM